MPPTENETHMNYGGEIGTDLATTTSVDRHRHQPRGDHTTDRRSLTETGTDSTARETGTGTFASVIGNENVIAI
jgi:hypothetical protein